jgi:hypothetical protein
VGIWDGDETKGFGLGGAGNKTKDRRFYRSYKVSSSAQPDLAGSSNDRESSAAALPRIVTAGTGGPLSIREVSLLTLLPRKTRQKEDLLLLGDLFYSSI